ncbi:MAG TPA: SRPBCC domain-containing protein [Acidimicrobiales bacterium]
MDDEEKLVFIRCFDAPQELLFRCMTEKEHLTHFWGPKGMTTPIDSIVVDLRPGGTFETTMVSEPDGSRYTMTAAFSEVRPPEHLAWIDANTGVVTTATFTSLGPFRTEIEIRQTNVPEFMRSADARAGFVTSFDRFSDYLRIAGSGSEKPT